MPDRATVSRWLARYEEFRGLYGFARECQAECLVDEILEIARDSSRDYVEKRLPDGKVVRVVDHENIARDRLRISALKWIAARMAPRKYGNQRAIELWLDQYLNRHPNRRCFGITFRSNDKKIITKLINQLPEGLRPRSYINSLPSNYELNKFSWLQEDGSRFCIGAR